MSVNGFEKQADVAFSREHFRTRLPGDRLYAESHYWIAPSPEGQGFRIGLTKFASRMLGEMVEYDFEVEPGATIESGLILGWMEGFKATSDIYSIIHGQFVEANPLLEEQIDLAHADPYGRGWLYRADGAMHAEWLDVQGYADFLNQTIDRMLNESRSE